MKILLIGDSITRGEYGHSFVNLLSNRVAGLTLINQGRNGDTIAGICQRLIAEIKINPGYDAIVIQAGYNDILLPEFLNRNYQFGFAYREQQRKGLYHLSRGEDIATCFRECIRQVRQYSTAKIIICTLGPVGENPDPRISVQRNMINECIRSLAGFQDVHVADIARAADDFLGGLITSSYCVDNFWSLVLTDRLIARLPGGCSYLSRKRKLWLTTDGVHLNQRGAEIFADMISQTLVSGIRETGSRKIGAPH